MRTNFSFTSNSDFKEKALQFANNDSHVVYLNPNSYDYPHGAFQHILAFGVVEELKSVSENNFDALKNFLTTYKDWTFGYLSYDLKNELENLNSNNSDELNFPLLNFFTPKHIIFFQECETEILSTEDPEHLYKLIFAEKINIDNSAAIEIDLQQKISKKEYIDKVNKLRQLILEGELYETNFCQEYFANNVELQPLAVYNKLNDISPMPFSSYLKLKNNYVLCASPERFLKKENLKLISQPIKGTAKRNSDIVLDNKAKELLSTNQKELSENIMIVDLVRNDLSRSALPGTVEVEELCKVYTFPQVHQMISTIVSVVDEQTNVIDIISKAFPMGSMTGAPKVRAMQLIEEFEESKRGIFSGSIGYFTPEMDFDFNVVIRSIFYNKETSYLSFQAGSAITYYAEAEKEYEECFIKTMAIRKALNL